MGCNVGVFVWAARAAFVGSSIIALSACKTGDDQKSSRDGGGSPIQTSPQPASTCSNLRLTDTTLASDQTRSGAAYNLGGPIVGPVPPGIGVGVGVPGIAAVGVGVGPLGVGVDVGVGPLDIGVGVGPAGVGVNVGPLGIGVGPLGVGVGIGALPGKFLPPPGAVGFGKPLPIGGPFPAKIPPPLPPVAAVPPPPPPPPLAPGAEPFVPVTKSFSQSAGQPATDSTSAPSDFADAADPCASNEAQLKAQDATTAATRIQNTR